MYMELRDMHVYFISHLQRSREQMEESRCAVVTGGNSGIGLEICRQLALNGIKVILTARNETRGLASVKKLQDSGITNVVFHQLDITDPTSVAQLVQFLQTHFTKLDILVNNASALGFRYIGRKAAKGEIVEVTDEKGELLGHLFDETYEMAEECFKTNYYGTINLIEALIPLLLLSKSPRIVNLTSFYGEIAMQNEKLRQELYNFENLTEERIEEIIEWFLKDFKAGKLAENGWPKIASAYKLSRAIINVYARKLAKKYNGILINCVHPGYIDTDFGFYDPRMQTVEEGAKGPIMAALLPEDGPSGVYFYQTKIAAF